MHPIEYLATVLVGAALLIASYIFPPAWLLWGLGLALVLMPVLGVPQWLQSLGRVEPVARPKFDPTDAED